MTSCRAQPSPDPLSDGCGTNPSPGTSPLRKCRIHRRGQQPRKRPPRAPSNNLAMHPNGARRNAHRFYTPHLSARVPPRAARPSPSARDARVYHRYAVRRHLARPVGIQQQHQPPISGMPRRGGGRHDPRRKVGGEPPDRRACVSWPMGGLSAAELSRDEYHGIHQGERTQRQCQVPCGAARGGNAGYAGSGARWRYMGRRHPRCVSIMKRSSGADDSTVLTLSAARWLFKSHVPSANTTQSKPRTASPNPPTSARSPYRSTWTTMCRNRARCRGKR